MSPELSGLTHLSKEWCAVAPCEGAFPKKKVYITIHWASHKHPREVYTAASGYLFENIHQEKDIIVLSMISPTPILMNYIIL